ncbi:MAG: hypothetical protein IMW89_01760 [Ktedonobacteraceae bacterium]|nr:hypothetical protein [Ktedonobacteraceae bacterium]
MFEQIFEESQLTQRIRIRAKAEAEASVKAEAAAMIKDAQARGKAEGRAEGRAEGEAKGLREAMISMIRIRFPRLAAEAATSQQLEQITAPEALRELYEQLLRAANEAEAQQLPSSPAA